MKVGILDIVLPIIFAAFLSIVMAVLLGFGIDVQALAAQNPIPVGLTLLVGFSTGFLAAYAYRIAHITYVASKEVRGLKEEILLLEEQNAELIDEVEKLNNQVCPQDDGGALISDASLAQSINDRWNESRAS